MQTDMDTNMTVDQPEIEEDQDSLFGSPPPSPTRGRSPSPNLALPSSSGLGNVFGMSGNGSSSCSTQNVGTIALPGSHLYSELPVNPLALSLSYSSQEDAPRPPAFTPLQVHPQSQHNQIFIPSANISIPSHTWSRASSLAPSCTTKKKVAPKAKPKPPAPRPAPPQIPLPDPSNPPPANFLRNQSALLGTAGLVGGVKPANLSVQRHTRGSTSANPIVVEDEQDQPSIGANFRSRSVAYPPPIDPTLLPAPTNEDIVATLIKQKDIFPVLESILKLIAAGADPTSSQVQTFNRGFAPTGYERVGMNGNDRFVRESSISSASSEGPPGKKRKLARVPAGAADWDIPYPFQNGEGPQAYRNTWERERGKQLIAQLVRLVKNAARKAATRNYLIQEEVKLCLESLRQHPKPEPISMPAIPGTMMQYSQAEAKVKGHYRPVTVTYGLEAEEAEVAKAQAMEIFTDPSNGNPKPTLHNPYVQAGTASSSTSHGTVSAQQSTPFDQLISSLLAASSGQGTEFASAAGSSSTTANMNASAETSIPPSMGADQEDFDPGLFENWMSILQTFPIPDQGFNHGQGSGNGQGQDIQPETLPQFDLSASTPVTNDNYISNTSMGAASASTIATPIPLASSTPSTDNGTQRPAQSCEMDMNMGANHITATSTSKPTPSASQSHHLYPDFAIDPTLLALSIPHPSQTNNWGSETGSPSMPSPMASTSSLGDPPDPLTPSGWDAGTPEVYSGSNSNMGDTEGQEQGLYAGGQDLAPESYPYGGGGGGQGPGAAEDPLNAANVLLELSAGANAKSVGRAKGKGKGKERQVDVHPTVQQFGTLFFPGLPSFASIAPTYTPAPDPTARTSRTMASGTQPQKDDVLKRAKERRMQLSAEIERAKVELWETTIEQGVLAHLAKEG